MASLHHQDNSENNDRHEQVPVFSCIIYVSSGDDGKVRARVANLPGLQCVAASEHQALATLDGTADGVNGTGVQSLHVTVKHPPALDQWRKLTGVVAATTEPNQRVRVEYQANMTSIEDIATQVVAAGWGLAELTPRRQTLEEVFVRLPCGQGVAEKTV